MQNIRKILLPVDFPNAALRVIRQAATLAHHFSSEIVMLHVVTPSSRAAGVPTDDPGPTGWDLLEEIVREAQKNHGHLLAPEIDGLTIQRVLAKGGVAQAIVQTAQEENADLIMMPSRGHTFNQFLLRTATAKGLSGDECPVWTGAHFEESPVQKFAIGKVLCVVDLNPHDRKTVSWAAHIASKFGAHLTLAHVTAGVKSWGPGGSYVHPRRKEALVGNAIENIADLQQNMGTKADVFIGSGELPEVLSRAAKQTKADLLVTGCRPYGARMRTHGYTTICAVPIPVLCV